MAPLQVGILGVSNFYRKRIAIPVAASPLIEFVAIASRSKQKAQEAAQEYEIPRAYESYDALLADQQVEAVYIPLPNHLHATWIKRAADAGKHVLCEKPIALTAAEAQDCLEYAAERGIIVMEAFMYRMHPQWRHVRQLIRQREIGNVQAVDVFFGFNNNDPDNIRNQKDTGGGALLDVGCYAVSCSRFLLGQEPQRVVSAARVHSTFDTDVQLTGIIDFGQALATFTVATQTFPHQRVVINGSNGIIAFTIPFNTYADVEAHVSVTTSVGTRDIYFPPEDQYMLEFEAFAQSIQDQKEVPVPSEDSFANMRVLDALRKSYESGQWEAVDN